MARKGGRKAPEVNSGSMADIAFLLLVFFLVTTQILNDKGLILRLPPKPDEQIDVKFLDSDVMKILINSNDDILIEGELVDNPRLIKGMVKEHVLNNGRNPELSQSPQKAVVSYKTDRGTSYETYLAVLDEIQAAYYEMYAERVGITTERYRNLDPKDPVDQELFDRAKKDFPMNISIAEPTKYGGN